MIEKCGLARREVSTSWATLIRTGTWFAFGGRLVGKLWGQAFTDTGIGWVEGRNTIGTTQTATPCIASP